MRVDLSQKRVEVTLAVAFRLGMLPSPSLAALLSSRPEEEGEYGARLSETGWLIHSLNMLRLRYANEDAGIKHSFRPISRAQMEEWYKSNSDLFTRYEGDSFDFEEVTDVVRKRMREEEWEGLIDEMACQQHPRG